MTDAAAMVIAAMFGAVIGSFLNVCIHRLPRGQSIVWPASACPSCQRQLPWFENIPLLSYIAIRARCRGCGAPISVRYPIVEGLTALMFAFAWWFFGPGLLCISRIIFGCALIVLFAVDLEHHVLPNVITVPGIAVGLGFSFFTQPGWASSLGGILLGAGVLWGIAEAYYLLRHEEGLGMGDVKMLAMVGAFVGWKLMLVTLMMASLSGSIIGLMLIATRRGGMKYALPFGTFLAMGAALAATVGPGLLDWYLSRVGIS
jgi:leader peptidase (prepilin peptidase)/N-methyltransferase